MKVAKMTYIIVHDPTMRVARNIYRTKKTNNNRKINTTKKKS
jgi:hypothetical protein